ncbi:hypothetical protein FQA39_LY08692 [Lamprigera yunnana]|nr:hypothetical protein FQA39_LY08692 [Lamprigera yunnana]
MITNIDLETTAAAPTDDNIMSISELLQTAERNANTRQDTLQNILENISDVDITKINKDAQNTFGYEPSLGFSWMTTVPPTRKAISSFMCGSPKDVIQTKAEKSNNK